MIYRLSDNVISPLGETTEQNYQAIKANRSALACYDGRWNLPEPFMGALFSDEQISSMAISGRTRFEALVINSINKAIRQSGIDQSQPNVVFILGTTKGNIELLQENDSLSPEYLLGETATRIATSAGITTRPIVACNACVSGVSAIILALRLLDGGFYDYAVVCGADVQNKFTVSGFQSLKAMSAAHCRPFDMERTGLNLGEAASTIVFMSDRLVSNFSPEAWRIASGSVRNDAFHISSPSKNGDGALLALEAAHVLDFKDQLSFVNAHGTATLFNDQMESVAIERAGLQAVPVNALKGYFGHTMGAAGVLETIISMCAVDDNLILGTKGFHERGVSGKIKLSGQNHFSDKKCFAKMISGLGGSNAALLISKFAIINDVTKQCPLLDTTHHIRLSPDGLWVDNVQQPLPSHEGSLITSLYRNRIGDYPKFYKMDKLSRLALVASEILLQTEGDVRFVPRTDRAVILFNRSASFQTDRAYLSTIINDDDFFPSPSAFIYTLPNLAVAEIAMRNHFHGETSLYILPEKDETIMQKVTCASFLDDDTESMVTGWIDFESDNEFLAELYIVTKNKTQLEKIYGRTNLGIERTHYQCIKLGRTDSR